MKLNYHKLDSESELGSLPITPGNVYFTKDTAHIWMDPLEEDTRILIDSNYVHNMTITVLDHNGNAVSDIYVNIYNVFDDNSKVKYDQIPYNGSPINVILPKDFKYLIEPDEIPGYEVPAASGTIQQDMELSFKYTECKIYGVVWDKSATTILARTGGAALFEEPVPYVAGATSYGSPFDNCMPWAGMTVSEDAAAGTVVAIPKFYYRWTNGSSLTLEIASSYVEGFSVSPAHRDRGDGKGERDVVYVGRYHCSANNFKSKTKIAPKVSLTRSVFRANIHALGDTIWQNDYALFWTIRMLYLVEYADWDSQKVIGYGRGNGSAVETMGYTDSMPYHTGTMLSSRTTYGVGTQYRNIEGVWDNCLDWCDGVYFSGANTYGILNPNYFSDTSYGTLVCTRPTTAGYISAWQFSTMEGYDWFMWPSAVAGSTTSYVADLCYYYASGVVLCVGGYYSQNLSCGMFYLSGSSAASSYGADVGSRLMILP